MKTAIFVICLTSMVSMAFCRGSYLIRALNQMSPSERARALSLPSTIHIPQSGVATGAMSMPGMGYQFQSQALMSPAFLSPVVSNPTMMSGSFPAAVGYTAFSQQMPLAHHTSMHSLVPAPAQSGILNYGLTNVISPVVTSGYARQFY